MSIEEAYQKTLDYLYSFVDFSLSRSLRYTPEQFDLGRMRQFVANLGQPQQAYPSIHIAGTKGKGSVAALCASALQAGGYRCGMYTSPHLHDYAERIQIDGLPIQHQALVELVDELRPAIEAVSGITTFEITTALAFVYFARQKVDVAVIEVGLGGRLDATNVITPTLTVITSLSFDHTHLLGNTLAEIAAEKAGIVKPGVPIVLAPQQDEARATVERIAQERGAPLVQVGRDLHFAPGIQSQDEQRLQVWGSMGTNHDPAGVVELSISLLGRHQVENAATAYAALDTFRSLSLPLSDPAIQRGFSQAKWPGRFEILSRQPLVLVDSAHNRDSALKLGQALDDYFPGTGIVLIFGASEDKDIEGMFAELLPKIQQLILTKSFHPRAADLERLVEMAGKYGRPVQVVPEVVDALEAALGCAGEKELVLATGSIFIVAGVREAWLRRQHEKQ